MKTVENSEQSHNISLDDHSVGNELEDGLRAEAGRQEMLHWLSPEVTGAPSWVVATEPRSQQPHRLLPGLFLYGWHLVGFKALLHIFLQNIHVYFLQQAPHFFCEVGTVS